MGHLGIQLIIISALHKKHLYLHCLPVLPGKPANYNCWAITLHLLCWRDSYRYFRVWSSAWLHCLLSQHFTPCIYLPKSDDKNQYYILDGWQSWRMQRSFLLLPDGLLDLHQTFLTGLFVFELYLHINQSNLCLLDQQFLKMQIFGAVVEYPNGSCSW